MSSNDGVSTQAVKRFKADTGDTPENGTQPTSTRRSLRTRSQDENTNVENRSTRAAAKQVIEEVGSYASSLYFFLYLGAIHTNNSYMLFKPV